MRDRNRWTSSHLGVSGCECCEHSKHKIHEGHKPSTREIPGTPNTQPDSLDVLLTIMGILVFVGVIYFGYRAGLGEMYLQYLGGALGMR